MNTACLLLDGLHLSEAGSKALLSNFKLSSKALVRLGRGIRDRTSRPSNSPHHHQQHGIGGAELRPSLTGHFDHGHSTPRNVWGPGHHAGHQQNNQLRTHHSQPHEVTISRTRGQTPTEAERTVRESVANQGRS